MIKHFQFSLKIMLLLFIFTLGAFPMGGKIPNIPMKTYQITDIPDGEFLHYGQYMGGEKIINEYFVTIKEKNSSGGFYYHVYEDLLSATESRKLPENYTNWPVSLLIDPARGSTILSEVKLTTNDLKVFGNFGVGDMIYSHYQFYPDKGIVKYTSKSLRGNEILTKSCTIKVNSDFPLVDAFSSSFIYRFVNPHTPGVFYYVIPDFMKEPFSLSIHYDKKDTVTTKAGTFHVNKVTVTMGDPFVGKLMEPFLKNSSLMIEDSERRLIVKSILTGSEALLEEVSNVNR